MDLFIYDWRYHKGIVYGISINNTYVKIAGFTPWEYVKTEEKSSITLKNIYGSTPVHVKKIPNITEDAILQFLTIKNINIVGWIHIERYTRNINNNTIDGYVYNCNIKNIKSIKNINIPDMHIISFDIEVYSGNDGFPNAVNDNDVVICIGTYSNIYGNKTFSGSENNMIPQFYDYITSADIVIGYNTHCFDWQYLSKRSGSYKAKIAELTPTWVTKQWNSSAFKNINIFYLDIPGILVLDLYHYCNRSYKIDNYKLNTVAEYFNLGSKIDLDVKIMWQYYREANIKPIIKYCENDCLLVYKIINEIRYVNDLIALANVTYTHPNTLFTQGQQIRVKNMLKHECIIYGYYYKLEYGESESYEGATVITPIPGMYENCACMDFASLYPSIIVSENICYTTYDKGKFNKDIFGIIPNLVNKLINERNRIRDIPSMKAYSNAIKISSNSIYGVFGSKGELHLLDAAKTITRIGRESLNKAIEYLESKNFIVIYGDTDSCIYTDTLGRKIDIEYHKKLANEVTELFNKPMQMKYESMYKRFLVLGKKMYITLSYDDKIVYKGVLAARRDTCKFIVDFYKNIVSRVMLNERFRDYCRDTIKNITNLEDEQFYIRKTYNGPYKSLSFPLEVYNSKYGPFMEGETFFVKVSYGKKLGDKLRPSTSNDKIDYLWYLEKLINPIDNVMSVSNKVFRIKYNIELLYN